MGCSFSKFNDDFPNEMANKKSTTKEHPAPVDVASSSSSSEDDDEDEDYYTNEEMVVEPIHKQKRALNAIIIGARGSGKTSIFNVMKISDGREFSPIERMQYSQAAWASALRGMRIMLDLCDERMNTDPELKTMYLEWMRATSISAYNKALERYASSNSLFGPIDDVLIQHFAELFDGSHQNQSKPLNGKEWQSQAVRNAARLLQCTDLSVRAFRDAQIDLYIRPEASEYSFGDEDLNSKIIFRSQLNESFVNKRDHSASWLSPVYNDMENSTGKRKVKPSVQNSRLLFAMAIHLLWASCPVALKSFIRTNELKFGSCNATHAITNIDKFVNADYLATDEDIVSGRLNDSNKHKTAMMIFNDNTIFITDVDAFHSERKQIVEKDDANISSIVYVVNVSAYDSRSEEFQDLGGLNEAFLDFSDLVSSYWSRPKHFHIILNKVDLLTEKCKFSPFSAFYPDFTENDKNTLQILNYIEGRFRDIAGEQRVFVYRTSATDITAMQRFAPCISDNMFSTI